MIKKIICCFGAVCLLLWSGVPAQAQENVPEPSVSAASAILIEAETGRVLFSKNAEEQRAMASTTKIMTALLTLEQEEREVAITADMIAVEGSSMGLRDGDRLTLHGLAAGMLSVSGNDAANAAAILIDGSLSAFADRMNRRAQELGLEHTHFVTPSGLDAEGHYTTASDLAALACAALENEAFRELTSSRQTSVSFLEPAETRTYQNHNKLLTMLDGCIGVKTGYTKQAGRCLVSAAEQNGIRLVAVTLYAPDDWNDHLAMMEYGFSRVERFGTPETPFSGSLPVTGGITEEVPVYGEQETGAPLLTEEADRVVRRVELPRFLYAPVQEGDAVGRVTYWLDGDPLASFPLYAGGDVPCRETEPGFWEKIAAFFGWK